MSKNVQVTVTSSWLASWLFTVGFTDINFWQSLWAIVVWPYYLGDYVRQLIAH